MEKDERMGEVRWKKERKRRRGEGKWRRRGEVEEGSLEKWGGETQRHTNDDMRNHGDDTNNSEFFL